MNGIDYSNQVKEEIKVLKKAQTFIESNFTDKYEEDNSLLVEITEDLKGLWKLYYATKLLQMNEVNKDLEEKLTELKNYNNGIDRIVTSVAQINEMLDFVAKLLTVFLALP